MTLFQQNQTVFSRYQFPLISQEYLTVNVKSFTKLPISSCYDYDGSTFIFGVLRILSQEALVIWSLAILQSRLPTVLRLTTFLGGWPLLHAHSTLSLLRAFTHAVPSTRCAVLQTSQVAGSHSGGAPFQ